MNILKKAKNILIVNDDGVSSDGLRRIKHYIMQNIKASENTEDYNVIVVSPEVNKSGCGASISVGQKLRINHLGTYGIIEEFSLSGTPVDCVHVGGSLFEEMGVKIDLVISGINDWPNLADDLIYSGTFCAAREANIIGVPAIALSYAGPKSDLAPGAHVDKHNKLTTLLALTFEKFFAQDFKSKELINVNLPAIDKATNEIKDTVPGTRHHNFATKKLDTHTYMIGDAGEFNYSKNSEMFYYDYITVEDGDISYTLC